MTRAAVLGAGSWGTAFAKVLCDAGTDVTLWARRPELADTINTTHENPEYLADITLPGSLWATADAAKAVEGADIIAIAIPAQVLRANLAQFVDLLPKNATLVSLMKGIELGTALRMSEVIREVTGADGSRVAVISGPNLAREIAQEQPTATVVGCVDDERATMLQRACTTPYFRPYTNDDMIGCELGGAVKNVIALACGMTSGMGMGDNTLGSLITRGLAETARLGMALGADPMTFAGLAGLGDLVATCVSPLSRNRTFGEHLGRGFTLAQATEATGNQIAEGVKSCTAVLDLASRHGVEVPITQAVQHVCHDGLPAARMVAELMNRSTKSE
jgi:glycerol-3-phosphate dehydrogenase (NAD(P)+)